MNSKITSGFLVLVAVFSIIAALPVSFSGTEEDRNEQLESKVPTFSNFREARGRKGTNTLLDSIDIGTYLRNKRAVSLQIDCLLRNGACDLVGKEIKRLMPLAMRDGTECRICSKQQLKKVRKVIIHLQQNYPKEWSEGVQKYGVAHNF